ncbi:MAG: transposase [Omnitrophica WOR_2 bacterium RIFCSPHIGHO2_01_FULL_48_9]|uniref:Transposase n=1 Tax=Candidatus Sungbacteria bacterium RIFCSPHIGHO2_02_FULL_47_11 TaxID=1802270 RepID=A0A1G2KJX5_9BACT|nr:MAG: transposase [Omnitrophica WOR_2 bacterium RIFCSPHIGHO2_01_FULL_48_9]OGZ99573.1 MAG: transposase [Candidatus Sungbacteria bacterium RIFCSPHIGHO2_02_FULL_47_11]
MSRHSKEFKLEAIRLMNEQERPIAEIARELGVKRTLLYRWRDEFNTKSGKAFKGSGRPRSDEMSELSRLRQENKALKEERDILKKAAAYFAKDLK